jgi:hypothetical protein
MKRIRLRRADVCSACGADLAVGTEALWEVTERRVTCTRCERGTRDPYSIDDTTPSAAGASARREYERREAATRSDGSVPNHVSSWLKGAIGEQELGAHLDRIFGVRVLHDRRVPGSRANLDHLVVAPTGVWVVDAKAHGGLIESRQGGPFGFGPARLFVNGRERNELIEGVHRQVGLVMEAVDGVRVRGALCFVSGHWSWPAVPFMVDGVAVHHPKSLRRALQREGPVDRLLRDDLVLRLDEVFRPWVRVDERA